MPFERRPEWWDYAESVPIRADGIKARSQRGVIGETWWSQRFIAVLESLQLGGRLARGRRYARMGQVVRLDVAPGTVTAVVQGSRATPYKVWVRVATLDDDEWARVENALLGQAVYLAKLLAGEMPATIEDAFAECSLSLFPRSARDLVTDCTCPDWENPCKHIAAVLYLLAEAFDADPFLIFFWRGRSRAELLSSLRASAANAGGAAVDFDDGWPADDDEDDGGRQSPTRFWSGGAAVEADWSVPPSQPATVPDGLLRQLEPIDVEVAGRNLAEAIAPAYPLIVAAVPRGDCRTGPSS